MSGQNTLLIIAEDAQVNPPSHKWNWQVYRDTAVAGSGTYKAMDYNGVIEIIGGPGTSAPLFSDQAEAVDDITTQSITDVVATGMTLHPPAGTYLVWFSGSAEMDATADAIFVSIYSDLVQVASSEERITNTVSGIPFNCVAKITTDGTNTITGRWRIQEEEGNTATMHQRNLTILKVG